MRILSKMDLSKLECLKGNLFRENFNLNTTALIIVYALQPKSFNSGGKKKWILVCLLHPGFHICFINQQTFICKAVDV